MNIQEFLARKGVEFHLLEHTDTYDAQRMAQAVHVSGHMVAKTVLLRTGEVGKYVIAVLPATHTIDLKRVAGALAVDHVVVATSYIGPIMR